jgi:hypothetical protein
LIDFVAGEEYCKEGPGKERNSNTRGKETYIQAGECSAKKVSS